MEKPLVIVGIMPDEMLNGIITLDELRLLLVDCLHLKSYV